MKLSSITAESKYIKNGQIAIIESIRAQKVDLITESEIKSCFPNASKSLITEYKTISENFLLIQSLFVNNSVDKLYNIIEKFDPNQRIGASDFGGDAEAMEKVASPEAPKAKEGGKPKAAFDPNKTVDMRGKADQRMGGGDFGGDADAMSKAKPGEAGKPDEKQKKGIIAKLKEFYGKVSEYMKAHPGQKMIIILAALGIVMTVASAFPAIGMVIKAIFGIWNMYKGSRKLKDELVKGKDKSKWQIALGILQLGSGIFSAASVGADVYNMIVSQKTEIIAAAAENGVQVQGGADAATPAPAAAPPDAAPPAAAPPADAATAAAAAPADMFTQGEQLKGVLGKVSTALRDPRLAEQYLNDPDKYVAKFTALCTKLGISPDSPIEQVFKGARAVGGTTVKEYIEMSLEGSAKAAKMAAMAR
jgi:hypothetical protein